MEQYGGSACQHIGEAVNTTVTPTQSNASCRMVALDTNIYFEGFLTAVVTMPANLFTVLTIDKVGRKVLLGKLHSFSSNYIFLIVFEFIAMLHNLPSYSNTAM